MPTTIIIVPLDAMMVLSTSPAISGRQQFSGGRRSGVSPAVTKNST